jgi:hypothetical protein
MLTVVPSHLILFLCVLVYLHGKNTVLAMYRRVTRWFVPFATKWFLRFIRVIPCLRMLRKTTSSPILSTSPPLVVSSSDRMIYIHWLVRLFRSTNAFLTRLLDRVVALVGHNKPLR